MLYPGRRTLRLTRIAEGVILILLNVLSFSAALPTQPIISDTSIPNGQTPQCSPASSPPPSSGNSSIPRCPGGPGSQNGPESMTAGALPDLSLPKTISANVGSPGTSTGVIQGSSDNLTLYNPSLSLRLLGGRLPHDELAGPDQKVLSSHLFWSVEVSQGKIWLPLLPYSSTFNVMGTNHTGTFVERIMQVGPGTNSGEFRILYRALPSGILKWDLGFTPKISGTFRFVYSWLNVTQKASDMTGQSEFRANLGTGNFTFSWRDVPSSYVTSKSLVTNQFQFSIDLGLITQGNHVQIDPSIVGSINYPIATGFTFQRKTFYEPKAGLYWTFYGQARDSCSDCGLFYSSSRDGNQWSAAVKVPAQLYSGAQRDPGITTWDVFSVGQTVMISYGFQVYGQDSSLVQISNYFVSGSIGGSTITWQTIPSLTAFSSSNCYGLGYCNAGTRYVYTTATAIGNFAFSYNAFLNATGSANCGGVNWTESDVIVLFMNNQGQLIGGPFTIASVQGCGNAYDRTDQDRSIVVPYDSTGKVQVIYQSCGGLCQGNPSLHSKWIDSAGNIGPDQTVESTVIGSDEFSAVVDANYGAHLVYRTTDGKVTYAYRPAGGTWTPPSRDIFSGVVSYPTITADYSTNSVYVSSIVASGAQYSIIMKSKTLAQSWSDQLAVYPVVGRTSPVYLTSNAISASMTNSSRVLLIWTEGSGPYNAIFASVPINTVWSPYASPTSPWDGNGIAPYGQYFANLGEQVSPSTGLLTVTQTDLNVPGRGLGLVITRVYTEPYSFLTGSIYNYEPYPWAPMGNGWQLNFPWMNNIPNPAFIHLWNGEGYRVPSSFWTGFTATFQNDQGEHFRLVRNVTSYIQLYTKTGTSYLFDPNHLLRSITDSTGNNTISFNYSSNLISCISDTLNRAFLFSYGGGLLQSISQVNGTCGSPGSAIRTVQYGNNGQSLTSVTDPANRVTNYSYSTGLSVAPWLLSRITYPTNWYTNYTYLASPLGSTATSYRIIKQYVGFGPPSATRVREFDYQYTNGPGDRVNNSTITMINGTLTQGQTVGFTTYSFSFAGTNYNVSDANHHFIRGDEQLFGVQGVIPREIILTSPTTGYTNYYSYDLYGNLIYSRNSASPTQAQESFSTYYNNGGSPGFLAFRDSFSQNQGTTPDNQWNVTNGYWMVSNGVYNGTETKGQQESIFSSYDIAKADVSVQARVYIARQINASDQRVGIFAHHTSTGLYKWILVLHNRPAGQGGGQYLELTDDLYGGWPPPGDPGAFQCSIVYNTWWTFNMTVHGLGVNGTASYPGQASPCRVWRTFSTSSPAIGGTAFGLYAGGYSALFDDVLVATVSPLITSTGFTNSFISNGAPGPIGLNTWLLTTKPPSAGWNTNTSPNWPEASTWIQAYTSQNYGGKPWNTISGWPDNNAQWIWSAPNANSTGSADPVWFRRIFNVQTATNVNIAITSDNSYILYLDGVSLGSGSNWQQVGSYPASFSPGYHVIGIYATNFDGPDPAGLLLSVKNTATNQVMFRTDATAGPNIVSKAGGALLQNGPGSLSEETYYGYTTWGGLNQTKQAYGGDPSQAQISITAWPTTDGYGRSWGLTTDQPLPVPWWPTYEVTVQSTNYTYVTSQTFSTGVHYVEFAISGFVPNYAWHAKIFVNGNLRAEGDVGRYNHLRAYFIVGTQYFTGSLKYDSFGNPKVRTDQMGNVTLYAYGAPGFAYLTNQTQLIGTAPITTLFTYDNNYGTMLSTTDPKGNTTSYQYDTLARLTRVTYPLSAYANYSYNDTYNYVEVTNENNLKTRQIYDGLGRLSTVERFSGGTFYSNATTVYNLLNLPTRQTDPIGNTYQYQYDALGRLTRTIKPDGNSTQLSYIDANSQSLSMDEYGNQRCTVRDFIGRIVSVIEYSDGSCNSRTIGGYTFVTNYNYDWAGNMRKMVTASSQTTTYVRDNLNRLIGINNSDGTFISANYDRTGNIIKKIDQNNVATLYSYDSTSRLQTVTHCGSTITSDSYTYDKVGNVVILQNQNATISSSFDARNRVLSETYAANPSTRQVIDLGCSGSGGTWTVRGGISNTDTMSFTYNGEFTSSIVYPGVTIQYSYDGLGRPANALHAGTGVYLATVAYYKNDQVKGIQYGNGLIGNYTYDNLGRYSTIKLANGGTTMMLLTYNYNKTGTVASVVGQVNQAALNETYSYDPLQRLTNARVVSSGVSSILGYQYDNMGNMLSQTLNGIATTYTYNAQNNELTGSSTPGTSTSYSYDNNGNLLSKSVTTSGTVNWSYSWDAANHLLKVTNSTGQVQYAYDGMGRMAVALESGSTTFFAYQGTNIIHKRLLNSDKYAYVYIAGLRVSVIISTSSRYYFHTDALGSTRMMTWQNAGMVYVDNYQPFGQDNGASQGSFTNRAVDKFTGQRVTMSTGLYYYFQRWYDPSIGRFISQDPMGGHLIEPKSLNRYIYVEDAPTSSIDPSGMADCGWSLGGFFGCLQNTGDAIVNGWNSLPTWAKVTIIVAVIVTVVVLTAGIGIAAAPAIASVGGVEVAADVGIGAGVGFGFGGAISLGGLGLGTYTGLGILAGVLGTTAIVWQLLSGSGADAGISPPTTGVGGSGAISPVIPGLGTASGVASSQLGSSTSLQLGGDISYTSSLNRWVRKTLLNPRVHRICLGSALVIGMGLYFLEDLHGNDPSRAEHDFGATVESIAIPCYVIAGFAASIPH